MLKGHTDITGYTDVIGDTCRSQRTHGGRGGHMVNMEATGRHVGHMSRVGPKENAEVIVNTEHADCGYHP